MKYNTGKASHQISAGERFHFGMAMHKGEPTHRQKQYLKFLMAKATENGVDIKAAMKGQKIESIQEYSMAIDKMAKALRAAGVDIPETAYEKKRKTSKDNYKKKKTLEALQTDWIYMTEKKPDRHIVNTLDEDGFVRTYEWDGRHFLDGLGNPVVTGRHRFKTPIAWARLG